MLLNDLNIDELQHIFKFLNLNDLLHASKVCIKWNSIINGTSELWENVFTAWHLFPFPQIKTTTGKAINKLNKSKSLTFFQINFFFNGSSSLKFLSHFLCLHIEKNKI